MATNDWEPVFTTDCRYRLFGAMKPSLIHDPCVHTNLKTFEAKNLLQASASFHIQGQQQVIRKDASLDGRIHQQETGTRLILSFTHLV